MTSPSTPVSDSLNQHTATDNAPVPAPPSPEGGEVRDVQEPGAQLDSSTGYAPNDNQLAGLVEAASAAGGGTADWEAAAAIAAVAATSSAIRDSGGSGGRQVDEYTTTGNMQMAEDVDDGGIGEMDQPSTRKRQRVMVNEGEPLDPALAATTDNGNIQRNESAHDDGEDGLENDGGGGGGGQSILQQSNAVGVHSSAALFRQPSTKKHTRPPMSKLFSSLEQTPENFLRLQAEAKVYMLAEDHPERRDCVGQRGRGDTEVVKLKLWNCVHDFLLEHDRGEQFFGEAVPTETTARRSHAWPRDRQKIISLVTPLLRRMVTNERQRQYAVEARKAGPEERKRKRMEESSPSAVQPQHYSPDEKLQLHHDHHTAAAPFPPPPTSTHGLQLGLTDLFTDGYPTDWETLSRAYDAYNQNGELDNLGAISGLQQADWRGLVAAVDSHYKIWHQGTYLCGPVCETRDIERILGSEELTNLRWRIGGGSGSIAQREFASSIIREISRIVRESLALKSDHATSSTESAN